MAAAPAGQPPVDVEIVRFIREEIREAVRDEFRAGEAQASTAVPPPPSYTTTQSSLESSTSRHSHEKYPDAGDLDIESQPLVPPISSSSEPPKSGISTLTSTSAAQPNPAHANAETKSKAQKRRTYLAYAIAWIPLTAFIIAVSALSAQHVVPFNIISLAAIFTGINYMLGLVLCVILFPSSTKNKDKDKIGAGADSGASSAEIGTGSWNGSAGRAGDTAAAAAAANQKDGEVGKNANSSEDSGIRPAILFSAHLFISTGFYALVLWAWFIHAAESRKGPWSPSIYQTTQMAADLQAVFPAVPNVLYGLTDCLQTQVGNGNGTATATVEDVGNCLRALGVY